MMYQEKSISLLGWSFLLAAVLCLSGSVFAQDDPSLDEVVARASKQVSGFVEQFSDVKCTEHVTQEKLGENDKIVRQAEGTFDYLVMLSNAGGELTLDESRLAVREPKSGKKHEKKADQATPLLVSNGFTMLFLVFHPYYAGSFMFSSAGDEVINGTKFTKIHFQHVRNTRSVAALAVRGREYPLELSGVAWVNPKTGVIAKITAGVDSGMDDIGMKSLHSEVEFAPVRFGGTESAYWFPSEATVEVQTPRQHWRNLHRFSDYKQFSVSTEEQVAKQ